MPDDAMPSAVPMDTGTLPRAVADRISQMDPAAASAELDRMSAAFHPSAPLSPQNAREASLRLQQLSNDPVWAKALTDGQISARETFQHLTQMIAGGDAGETDLIETTFAPGVGDGPLLRRRDLISAAEDMRALWSADAIEGNIDVERVIDEVLNSPTVDVELVRQTQYVREAAMSDPEFTAALLRGEHWARARSMLWSAIIGVGADI
jgi:hypothetical protein